MIPPPLRSTLFPYTTLFRSGMALNNDEGLEREADNIGKSLVGLGQDRKTVSGNVIQKSTPFIRGDYVIQAVNGRGKGKKTDRKSTRLNSSHRCISYAVFCLK